MSLPKSKPLPMGVQQACIQERFPQFNYSRINNSWTGKLKPTATSPEYLVKIVYKPCNIPQVYVLKPKIHPDAPHIYKENDSLCLYYPPDDSWNGQKLIGNTIIPWAAEWLYFYEIWLIAGQWYGPEAPHSISKNPNLSVGL